MCHNAIHEAIQRTTDCVLHHVKEAVAFIVKVERERERDREKLTTVHALHVPTSEYIMIKLNQFLYIIGAVLAWSLSHLCCYCIYAGANICLLQFEEHSLFLYCK